jgi:hypothetical protein
LEIYSSCGLSPTIGRRVFMEKSGKPGSSNPYDLSAVARGTKELRSQSQVKIVRPGDPYTLSGSKLRNALSLKRGTGYLKG